MHSAVMIGCTPQTVKSCVLTPKFTKKEPKPTPTSAAGAFINKTQAKAMPDAGHTADAKPGGIASNKPKRPNR